MESPDLQKPDGLRFGVLCSGVLFQAWQVDCLHQLVAMDSVKLALLVVYDDGPGRSHRPRGLRAIGRPGWRIYRDRIVRRRARSARPVDMTGSLAHVPVVHGELIEENGVYLLQQTDVAEVQGHNLDFILYLGTNTLGGGILEASRYGVWMFCHGRGDKRDGYPPAFGEILRGDAVTAASLRRLGASGQSIFLKQGFIKTIGTSYIDNLDTVSTMSAAWPAQVCTDILNGHAFYLDGPCSAGPIAVGRPPNSVEVIGLALAMAANRVRYLVDALCFFPQWNLGIVGQPIEAFLEPGARPPVRWLPPPPSCTFWADPFALHRGDVVDILFEDYDYHTHKGRISAVRLSGESFAQHRVVMDMPWHLSYPYLLEHRGRVYCIPESARAGEISLYQAEDSLDRWVKVATLVEGFVGSDSTLFYYEDRWWLLANEVSRKMDHELHAWHSPHLLGPWVSHANNPIKVDVRSSRSAGTPFIHAGHLYRPAQDCTRTYGGRVVINRVHRLTPTEFEEESVATVEPYENSPYPDGLHTLSAVGNMTLIDGQKNVFIATNWPMLRHGLQSRLKRIKWLLSRGEPHQCSLGE